MKQGQRKRLGPGLAPCGTCVHRRTSGSAPLRTPPKILHDEPPLPPAGAASEELRDFVRCCLETDPRRRPNAEQLLGHHFVRKHAPAAPPGGVPPDAAGTGAPAVCMGAPAAADAAGEAKRFMACMVDPLEKCAKGGKGWGPYTGPRLTVVLGAGLPD
jgi:hypothetical protein